MKTALVHDWLVSVRGGERVLQAILDVYPSPVHTLVHGGKFHLPNLAADQIKTSSLQKIPFAERLFRLFLYRFPRCIEEFDLSEYEVILSTSSAVAKGVLSAASQLHICYIHSPMRYAWDLYFQYLREAKLERGPLSWYARRVLHSLRQWDVASSNRVDHFVANSKYVAQRVAKLYRRKAEVIHPPVNVERFVPAANGRSDYYLAASALVQYKKVDLVVEAFKQMPDRRLIVAGSGPMEKALRKAANGHSHIQILGHVDDATLVKLIQEARAFVFAAEEDFGILPVEAQACGVPVLAYGTGGALETVLDKRTGLFFTEQNTESLINCVRQFEGMERDFDTGFIRTHAQGFSEAVFKQKYQSFVEARWHDFRTNGRKDDSL